MLKSYNNPHRLETKIKSFNYLVKKNYPYYRSI